MKNPKLIYFFLIIYAHNCEKNGGYKTCCDWPYWALFRQKVLWLSMVTNREIHEGTFFVPLRMNFAKSLKSFVTLNGHKREKNEGYKIFCDHALLTPFTHKKFCDTQRSQTWKKRRVQNIWVFFIKKNRKK
jgi:hypothetical protein